MRHAWNLCRQSGFVAAMNRDGARMGVPIILAVEDEFFILEDIATILRGGGYTVVSADSGEEAIRLLDAPDANFRALVTDVNLGKGKLTGWDVARHAREITADIPVIYVTGDGAPDWTSMGVPNSIVLIKPYAPAQLVTAVSQLLNLGPIQPA
jgi:CheY-like chemotaxis protein